MGPRLNASLRTKAQCFEVRETNLEESPPTPDRWLVPVDQAETGEIGGPPLTPKRDKKGQSSTLVSVGDG